MKNVILVALSVLVALPALARYSRFEGIREVFCPTPSIDYDKDVLTCGVSNADVVISARVGKALTADESKNLGFFIYGAVDLGIVPDADSDTAYFYTRWLLNPRGEKVGVLTIEGWTNSEMEDSAQFRVRYDLQGEVVIVTEQSI